MGNPFNIKMSPWGTKIFIWQIGWFHVSIPEIYWNVARYSWSSLDSLYRYDFLLFIVFVYPGTYILNFSHQYQTIYKRRQRKTGFVKSYLMETISVYSPEYEYKECIRLNKTSSIKLGNPAHQFIGNYSRSNCISHIQIKKAVISLRKLIQWNHGIVKLFPITPLFSHAHTINAND